MSKRPHIILPTVEEDAAITAAALSDPDAQLLTDMQLQQFRKPGRPKSTVSLKVATTIRFDADVINELRGTGKGWQTRVNQIVRDWLRDHPHVSP
jgi:uncharacterized protein (DUF4415 family)